MPEELARQIEKKFGKRIIVALSRPEFRQERVGRFTVPIPYYRFKLAGERRWREARA